MGEKVLKLYICFRVDRIQESEYRIDKTNAILFKCWTAN